MESWFGSNSIMEFEAKIPKKFGLPYYILELRFKVRTSFYQMMKTDFQNLFFEMISFEQNLIIKVGIKIAMSLQEPTLFTVLVQSYLSY